MTTLEKIARAQNTYAVMYTNECKLIDGDAQIVNHRWTVHRAVNARPAEEDVISVHTDKAEARNVCALLNARAAVEAMREPDEAMMAAANAACDEYGQVRIKSGYRAMIDAILQGE